MLITLPKVWPRNMNAGARTSQRTNTHTADVGTAASSIGRGRNEISRGNNKRNSDAATTPRTPLAAFSVRDDHAWRRSATASHARDQADNRGTQYRRIVMERDDSCQ